jgi:hypothetical protein
MSKVTVTPTALRPSEVSHVDLEVSFNRIREGKSKDTVAEIRIFQQAMDKCDKSTEQGKKDYKALKKEKDALKLKLPSWSYSGELSGRKNDNVSKSSGLMVCQE